eukprot:4533985-Amphidinium_carterae.2
MFLSRSATKKRQAASPDTVKDALDYKAPAAEYLVHVERFVRHEPANMFDFEDAFLSSAIGLSETP